MYSVKSGLIKYVLGNFTTDDPNCEITGYQANSLPSAITQKACDEVGITEDCKTANLNTEKAGDYQFNFEISAEGGSIVN